MPWPGDLLRFLYGHVGDTPLDTDCPSCAPAASLVQSLSANSATDHGQNEEVALAIENQQSFLKWETDLASRSGVAHDFEARDPAASGAGREAVAELLTFLNDQLKEKQESSSRGPSDKVTKQPDEPSELAFREARSYAAYVAENGRPNQELREALRPSTLSQLVDWVARITRLHVILEQHHEEEDAAAASAGLSHGIVDAKNLQTDKDPHDMLYEHLNKREGCELKEHLAYLQLSSADKDDLRMFLPGCKVPGESQSLHETSFMFEGRSPPNAKPMKICDEVHRYLGYRRRLCLSFHESKIWARIEPHQTRNSFLQTPKPVSLDTLFEREHLYEDKAEIQLKKSRLALQLALALHRLYPGPWVQKNWNADAIYLLTGHCDNASNDWDHVCICCKLESNWKASNPVWQEYSDAQGDTGRDSSTFFLYFAQLLIDISEGRLGSRPQTPSEDWRNTLFDEAVKTAKNKFLENYGAAIYGCLQYSLDYDLERMRIEDPRARARSVVRKNIVENLQMNLRFWEAQWNKQQHPPWPGLAVPLSQSPPAPHGAAKPSFFTLFASGDEEYENFELADKSDNDFMTYMENFKHDFILALPEPLAPPDCKPIRIAVLDTGLHVDDRDILLASGSSRMLKKLCKNFLGTEDERENYNDTHGHGTHVVRLLLRLAPRAHIIVVKISEGRYFESTNLSQVIDALKWAAWNAEADIINLSFGLDEAAKVTMKPVIGELVHKGKLIFAAASNSGGNGKRAYPAKEAGVFAIHATNEHGKSPDDINPPRDEAMDNFATLGYHIPSFWDGKNVLISGTSFATSVAAAIAANALEFVQRAPSDLRSYNPRYFFGYSGMNDLFREMASRNGDYDYIRPWKDKMFDGDNTIGQMHEVLQNMSVTPRHQRTSA